MKRILLVFALLALTLVVAHRLYQIPRVKVLFDSAPEKERPLEFLENLPPLPTPAPRPEPRSARRDETRMDKSQAADAPDESSEPVLPPNRVSNEEVATVLSQILAARRLREGVDVSVSDQAIILRGEVDTEEKRRLILELAGKARESRVVDAGELRVVPKESP